MKKQLTYSVIFTILLTGCSSSGIAGKYYYQSYSGGLDEETYFELKNDGTCTMVSDEEEKACTYGDGIITIGEQSVSYKITKKVMKVTFPGTDGESMSFEKK